MLSTCSFLFFLVLVSSTFALPPLIRIGGLFAEDQLEQQLVFHAALEAANAKYSNRTVFEPVIETVGRYNSFLANIKSKTASLPKFTED